MLWNMQLSSRKTEKKIVRKMDKRLENVIRQTFNLKEGKIEEDWTSDDIIGWDSMGHLALITAVEKEFNVRFEIEEMLQIRSLKDIGGILKQKNCNCSDVTS